MAVKCNSKHSAADAMKKPQGPATIAADFVLKKLSEKREFQPTTSVLHNDRYHRGGSDQTCVVQSNVYAMHNQLCKAHHWLGESRVPWHEL